MINYKNAIKTEKQTEKLRTIRYYHHHWLTYFKSIRTDKAVSREAFRTGEEYKYDHKKSIVKS